MNIGRDVLCLQALQSYTSQTANVLAAVAHQGSLYVTGYKHDVKIREQSSHWNDSGGK